jgi:hypothetical protein
MTLGPGTNVFCTLIIIISYSVCLCQAFTALSNVCGQEPTLVSSTCGQAPALLAKKLNKAGKACQGQTLQLIYYK